MPAVAITIPVTVQAQLETSQTTPQPVAAETLDFQHRVTGTTAWTDDGNFNTDLTGTAGTTLQLQSGQTYDFQVIFAGDAPNGFGAATGQKLGFTVTVGTKVVVTVSLV